MPRPVVLLLCGAALTVLAACAASQPMRYYVLDSIAATTVAGFPEPVSRCSVGVGPIIIPEYLDRLEIVTRSKPAALEVGGFDRWGEPLDKGVPRILAENLRIMLSSQDVSVYPWPGSNHVVYQIPLEVIRFDGILGREALLEARWSIVSERGKYIHLKRGSSIREPVSGTSYESFVSAQSRALVALSREMASAVTDLLQKAPNQ